MIPGIANAKNTFIITGYLGNFYFKFRCLTRVKQKRCLKAELLFGTVIYAMKDKLKSSLLQRLDVMMIEIGINLIMNNIFFHAWIQADIQV